MKKAILFTLMSLTLLFTGCLKKDNFENIEIYTTSYPIEFITSYIYGNHSTIYSIYPDSADINKYSLTNKQIKDYSKSNMYVFNGLNNKEQEYLISMVKHNKDLKMIDATQSMEINYNEEELWLDPSNFLMMSLNIKDNLLEYITNHYLIEEINNNYNDLKVKISNIDAKLKLLSENSNRSTIVVDTNTLKFLEKYGFTVISLEEGDLLTQKTISEVKTGIKNGTIKYIYTLDEDNINQTVKDIKESSNVEIVELNKLTTLTDKQRSEKEDYISITNENIELLKKELYN